MYKNQDIYLFKSYSSVIFKPSRTCTEQATKVDAKYLQHNNINKKIKRCIFNNLGK